MVGVALFMASACVKVEWAKQQTHALCGEITVGGLVESLDAKAHARGLIVWSSPARKDPDGRPRPAKLTAWEGFAFARWSCDVEHGDGRALSKRTSFLD